MAERPTTSRAVVPAASGGFIAMPSNPEEQERLYQECLNTKDWEMKKKGSLVLEYMDNSTKAFRNPFGMFCMLMGDTGAGKSSTINHLLGTELPVSHDRSETSSVDAFTIETQLNELKISGLKCTIVDTPGFNDSRGLEQNACNFITIRRFLEKSISMGGRPVFPNFILLCVKSSENRIVGKDAPLVRNLQTLKALRVIDPQRQNLLVVVTRAGSLPNGSAEMWIKKTKDVTKMYQDALRETLKYEVSVVFIENNYEEYGLQRDESHRGTLLPNKAIQPENLFYAMAEISASHNDEVGRMILRETYVATCTKNIKKPTTTVHGKIATDITALDDDEKACLEILKGDSELFKTLEAMHEERLEETKRLHKREVQRLQRVATEDRNAKVKAEKQRNEALKNTQLMEGKLQMQTQHKRREEQWPEEQLERERDYQVKLENELKQRLERHQRNRNMSVANGPTIQPNENVVFEQSANQNLPIQRNDSSLNFFWGPQPWGKPTREASEGFESWRKRDNGNRTKIDEENHHLREQPNREKEQNNGTNSRHERNVVIDKYVNQNLFIQGNDSLLNLFNGLPKAHMFEEENSLQRDLQGRRETANTIQLRTEPYEIVGEVSKKVTAAGVATAGVGTVGLVAAAAFSAPVVAPVFGAVVVSGTAIAACAGTVYLGSRALKWLLK